MTVSDFNKELGIIYPSGF